MASESVERKLPLIVIAGPTASGKTALAIKMARRFGGEIVCADSRTVYKGMDVGTAKPTTEEQALVPHWGLNLVEPGERFTVADFKDYAEAKICEIRQRGHIPFLVGGTGLYIDSVVFDFAFTGEEDDELRQRLGRMNIEELQNYCINNNIKLPENDLNKRYLVRAIERKSIGNKRRQSPIDGTFIVGITTEKKVLRTRIEFRSEQLFSDNVVKEATLLGKKYGWDSEAMTGNIYSLVKNYLTDDIDEAELKRKFTVSDWRLAKRQMTWLRRNPYIMWSRVDSAEQYLSQILANQ